MIKASLALTAAASLLVATTTMGIAAPKQTNPQNLPPGQMMHKKGSVHGTDGASGYTPGHEMQKLGSKNGPGASGYAPGHEPTSTGSTHMRKR